MRCVLSSSPAIPGSCHSILAGIRPRFVEVVSSISETNRAAPPVGRGSAPDMRTNVVNWPWPSSRCTVRPSCLDGKELSISDSGGQISSTARTPRVLPGALSCILDEEEDSDRRGIAGHDAIWRRLCGATVQTETIRECASQTHVRGEDEEWPDRVPGRRSASRILCQLTASADGLCAVLVSHAAPGANDRHQRRPARHADAHALACLSHSRAILLGA